MKQRQSLFKQKINQTKIDKQQIHQIKSFPIAQKIQLDQTKQVLNHQQTNNKNKILQEISTLVSKEQFNKIQAQNDQLISQMSKEQIQSYKKSIISQIPSTMLEKLSYHQNHVTSTNPQHPNQMHEGQIHQQHQNKKQSADQNYKNQTTMEYLQQILVDITTSQLYMIQKMFKNNSKINQNLVSIQELKMMIESENNQTQVIGSQILTKLLINFPKQKIINLNGHMLHHNILIEEILKNIIPSLLFKIKNNKFISCWTPFMTNLCFIIKNKYAQMPESIQKMCLKTIQLELHTKRQTNLQTQNQIRQTYNFIINQSKNNYSNNDVNIDNFHTEEIIQLLVLQEAEEKQYQFKKTITRLNQFLQKVNNQRVLKVLYQIVSLFKIVCNQKQKHLVSSILVKLNKNLQKVQAEKQEQQKGQTQIFKYLVCLKEINPQKFTNYIEQFNRKNNLKEHQIGMLVFLNINHYSNGQISEIQMNNLRVMIQFLIKITKDKSLILQTILSDFLYLYQNQSSPYNQLPQIQQIIHYLVENCSIQSLKSIIPKERMRHLCQKYNFSSYGNVTFTKLLFYLAVIDDQFEGILVEEVINRYPFLFYYVVEENGVYSNPYLYKYNDKYANEKKQISQMVMKTPDYNKNNIFLKYLINN